MWNGDEKTRGLSLKFGLASKTFQTPNYKLLKLETFKTRN